MSSAVASFSCAACGRSFAWKSEYAGKTLKCKCGQPIKAPTAAPVPAVATRTAAATKPAATRGVAPAATAPATPVPKHVPVPTPAAAPEDDFAKLVSEAEYELATAPPPPPPTRRVTTAPLAPAAASAGRPAPASPLLAYGRAAPRVVVDEGTQRALVTDFYIPIGLIVVGLIAYYFDAVLMGFKNPVSAGVFVILNCVANSIMIMCAMLVAVKVIDLGIGPIGTASLKIVAVALLPAALADIIGYLIGVRLVGRGIALLIYYLLLLGLFDMDGGDVRIVTAIMWVLLIWVRLLLITVLFSALGSSLPSMPIRVAGRSLIAADGMADGTATGSDKVNPTYFESVHINKENGNETPVKPEEVDQQANDLLTAGKTTEAKLWLDNSHHISRIMQKKAMQMRVDQIYQAGARRVYIADIETVGPDDFASQYLIELPDDPAARKTTLKMADDMNQAIKPTADDGRKFIVVPVD